MITIIHGDDTASSRNYLVEQKDKIKNYFSFEGKTVTLNDLIQVIESGGLFSDTKILFIENFFSTKNGKDFDKIVKYLKEKDSACTIFFWEERELTKGDLSRFSNARIEVFKIPQTIFAFLDSINPGNGKNLVVLFHKTLENTATDQVMYMIIRQFRFLLSFFDRDDSIEEIKRLAPWQKSKLERQAKLFSLECLKKIYHRLYQIDKAQKTGELKQSLACAIDFLLLDI